MSVRPSVHQSICQTSTERPSLPTVPTSKRKLKCVSMYVRLHPGDIIRIHCVPNIYPYIHSCIHTYTGIYPDVA